MDGLKKTTEDIFMFESDLSTDYYSILGCDENSSVEQIAAEYKARVLSCHPDKHPDDSSAHEKFSLLSRAKETLLDPTKRRDYDKWRHSGLAISYSKWCSMSHVKTSMHWGVVKPQPSLSHTSDVLGEESNSLCAMTSQQPDSENLQQLKKAMAFTPRECSSESASVPGWQRETANPLLQKFRNYQI